MTSVRKKTSVLSEVKNLQDRYVALCCDLIRTNTVNPYAGENVTGSEAAGQDVLEKVLRKIDPLPTIRRFDPPDDIYERAGFIGPKKRNFRGRPNLTADWELGEQKQDVPSIVLNSHIDTVGVKGMTIEPFSGEISDGKIWGRGATDTKGALVTALWAIEALLKSGIPLQGKILFESVVDEECNGSGAGTLACRLAGRTADEAIVLDGDVGVIYGCDGVITAGFDIIGKSGHSGEKDAGVNAIEKALVVKQAIDAWKIKRLNEYPIPANLGVFHAGTVPSMIPARASMAMNALYGIEEAESAREHGYKHTGEPVFESLVEEIRAIEKDDPWLCNHPTGIEWVKDLPPFRLAENNPLIKDLADAYAKATRKHPHMGLLTAWTDAAHFANQSKMPVVLFGAGDGCSHADEEWVRIETLYQNAATLALFLLKRFGI